MFFCYLAIQATIQIHLLKGKLRSAISNVQMDRKSVTDLISYVDLILRHASAIKNYLSISFWFEKRLVF